MANTWRATAQAVAYASGKSMLDVFNGGASARIVRGYRGYWFNNGTAAVTGVLTEGRVHRTTASSAGTAVTLVAHDTNNSALHAATTGGTGRTVTNSSLFRKFLYSNDEPAASGATMDEWELLVPFAEVWNAGYADANIQPLVCRAGQGVNLHHQGTSAVGSADLEWEVTDAAT